VSIRATNFVRRLRGLTPAEKAVAFVLADHDDHKGGGIYASMSTVAEEAGLENRETASRVTGRLVEKGIFLARPAKGKPTLYRVNYDLAPVTPQSHPPVTPQSHPTCDSTCDSPARPVTLEGQNQVLGVTLEGKTCDSPVTQRVLREKKERETQEEGEEGRSVALAPAPTPAVEVLSATSEITTAFDSLGDGLQPFGPWELQNLWASHFHTRPQEALSDTLERFFVDAKKRRWKIPTKWTEIKRAVEKMEAHNAIHIDSIQERHKKHAHKEFLELQERAAAVVRTAEQKATITHEANCDGHWREVMVDGHKKLARCACGKGKNPALVSGAEEENP